MPHLKCESCRTRLYLAASGDEVGDLCPACGSLLEPVGELAELIGFQLIECVGSHQRIADRLGDLIARRQEAYALQRSSPSDA
jgi:Zn-finger nucleic acid-binding protein